VVEKRREPPKVLARMVHRHLEQKIGRGTETVSDYHFLHTEPHHDDLMLGYLPWIVRHIRDQSNMHYFATLTSGFTAVTDQFMIRQLRMLSRFLETETFQEMALAGYFVSPNEEGRQRDVWQYLDGVAAGSEEMKNEGIARRLIRDILDVYGEGNLQTVRQRIEELEDYFERHRPGEKDVPEVQRLKGMRREWEAECLWGYFGWNCTNVRHLRLGFYTGEIFTEEPSADRDVPPVTNLLQEVKPDVVSVALDPEGSGPDTHYKVLQVMSDSLKRHVENGGNEDIRVWGYRNVWYRFHPAEANVYVPVTLNMFSIMESAFMDTFNSQRNAPFPSYQHDGPFSELARKIQVEQYQKIKTCLGREWFHNHPNALVRATRGLVMLKDMKLNEFYRRSRELREFAENR
jgi:glucosamine-6-phosphate deaminase